MESDWDVVVAGLGAMGAATTWELARRGLRVLAIDRFEPLHALGSSHGSTRIIREAYFEHPLYVPLVHRAWQRWHLLEQETGLTLARRTGGLNIAQRESEFLDGLMRSIQEHHLAHECLDRDAIIARYPALMPEPGTVGVFEPRASVLFAEACVRAFQDAARARAATLRFREPLHDWKAEAGALLIETETQVIRAKRLVLALGPWTPAFVDFSLAIERQCVFWFEPLRRPFAFQPDAMPITLWEHGPGQLAYAFPDLGNGVKASLHHQGSNADLETIDRVAGPADEARIREQVERIMPDAAGRVLSASVCLYTNTPDFHFLIDRHPEDTRVIVISACSGHGFKFAPAIAELAADLVEGRKPEFDVSPFRAERLAVGREAVGPRRSPPRRNDGRTR